MTSLKGSGVALAIGIVGAVWAGLGVTLAMGRALDTVWAVPRLDRPDYVYSRLRGLAILVTVGTAQILTTVVVTLARNGTIKPPVAGIASFGGSAAIDFLVFVTAFRVLTTAGVTTRQVLPGAVLATISWLGLQTLGGLYVEHVVAQSTRPTGSSRRSSDCSRGCGSPPSSASSPARSTSSSPSACGRDRSSAASRRPTSARCAWPRRPSSATARQHIVVSFDPAAEPPAQAQQER